MSTTNSYKVWDFFLKLEIRNSQCNILKLETKSFNVKFWFLKEQIYDYFVKILNSVFSHFFKHEFLTFVSKILTFQRDISK